MTTKSQTIPRSRDPKLNSLETKEVCSATRDLKWVKPRDKMYRHLTGGSFPLSQFRMGVLVFNLRTPPPPSLITMVATKGPEST